MYTQVAEVLGTLVGLLYLYWEYQADRKVWIAGIIMPAISLLVYWQAGLYADFGINVYYLLAAFYGLFVWSSGTHTADGQPQELPITHTPSDRWMVLIITCLLAHGLIGWVLTQFTTSDVPWWDAFTTALSIVGLWMLSRKWVEQWLVWIAVDVVSAGLYVYKDLYFYAGLYALYAVIAVLGYRSWKKRM